MQPLVSQVQLQLLLLPLLLPLLQPQPQELLQPQLLQPQLLLQPQPQVLVEQQGLQQELATKSGNTMLQRLEELLLQEEQELQAIKNPPKKQCRGGFCLHDILCAIPPARHIQPSKIIVSSRLATGLVPTGPSGQTRTSSMSPGAPLAGGTGWSRNSWGTGLSFFFFIPSPRS